MRSVGGVLLAAGAIVVLSRKAQNDQWGTFAQLLVVLIPALILYLVALARPRARAPAEPDQTVLAVTAILLSPVVFVEFERWSGISTSSSLSLAGVFALAALLAAYTARRARVTYAALLAGLAALIAWLFLWDKILDHPSADTFRWLLIAAAAILFCAAGALSLGGALGSSEVATAGGLAAVSAGVIGVVVSSVLGAIAGVSSVISSRSSGISRAGGPSPRVESEEVASPLHNVAHHLSGAQHLGWDVYLLVVALALVWVGSRMRVRGLGYVGVFGAFAFLISIAAQLTRLQAGHARTSDIVGWPLVLVLVGAAGVLIGSRTLATRERPPG
jgi:hypothetical protein